MEGAASIERVPHPEDAEKAVSLGVDGIWVSNQGGRQIEALVPSIDVLPSIVAAVGKKATDSGIRSGQDVMRAVALGARAAFAGKSFLWAVGAMGDDGPSHLIDLFTSSLFGADRGGVGSRRGRGRNQSSLRMVFCEETAAFAVRRLGVVQAGSIAYLHRIGFCNRLPNAENVDRCRESPARQAYKFMNIDVG